MIFTGKNLKLLKEGIERAISDIGMNIGMIAGGGLLADEDIADREEKREKFQRLLARIERAIERETTR